MATNPSNVYKPLDNFDLASSSSSEYPMLPKFLKSLYPGCHSLSVSFTVTLIVLDVNGLSFAYFSVKYSVDIVNKFSSVVNLNVQFSNFLFTTNEVGLSSKIPFELYSNLISLGVKNENLKF